MHDIRVSVVVVSLGRPTELSLCLTSLSQQQGVEFEIVVVADRRGMAAVSRLPFAEHLTCLPFDVPNISAARNIGIAAAGGDVIAFIDDDAVAEPSWLSFLAMAFSESEVSAATGFVRGGNGISFQRKGQRVTDEGVTLPLAVDERMATVLPPPGDGAIKTEGTNMAFRRAALVEHAGFDEAFHYFLDETDLNMRMAQEGRLTAIVPTAQVHHRMAPNRTRDIRRVPRDLFDLGASWAAFHRKHVPAKRRHASWDRQREIELWRLSAHMEAGRFGPKTFGHLVESLDRGHAEGLERPSRPGRIDREPQTRFRAFPSTDRQATLLGGRIWSSSSLRDAAERAAADGQNVTLVELSPTARPHRVRYVAQGYWLQQGGLFGRSSQEARRVTWHLHRNRIRAEGTRVEVERILVRNSPCERT